jgi:adenylate cyclase
MVILGVGILLFRQSHIRWLPPGESLLVLLLTTPAAFAYTFFAEDRQRRFMLKALSKVVSPAIAEQLASEPERLSLGTVRTDISVLFTDLANFTTLSESMADEQVGELLNRYLGAMSDQVFRENGTLDKYIGDAVMCFWNAPLPQEDHAVLACRTALAMLKREDEIRAELGPVGQKLYTRIGINTTSAAVGFVGSSHLFNYTAIGDGVNIASRLEGANKIYGTRILIAEHTANLVKGEFILRRIDKLCVKGRTEGIPVYEVIAERSDPKPPSMARIEQYELALAAYQKQNWDTAERILLELCGTFGEDSASRTLLQRIAILRVSPPAGNWDGTYEAKDK